MGLRFSDLGMLCLKKEKGDIRKKGGKKITYRQAMEESSECVGGFFCGSGKDIEREKDRKRRCAAFESGRGKEKLGEERCDHFSGDDSK